MASEGTSSAAASRPSNALRLAVFDFDQTLSVVHVFKALAGWGSQGGDDSGSSLAVPAPFACSERGQMQRIAELDRSSFQEAGGFAQVAFGGPARVEKVDKFLKRMREKDVELVVCTKGLVGAVQKCLHDLKLLPHFSEVYGNVGTSYGLTQYDRDVAEVPEPSEEERQLLSTAKQELSCSKDRLIQTLMAARGLSSEQCVLVEDDPEEIRRAQPVCRTLFVREAAGITDEHMAALLAMAAGAAAGKGAGGAEGARTRVRGTGRGARFSDLRSRGVWRPKRPASATEATAE